MPAPVHGHVGGRLDGCAKEWRRETADPHSMMAPLGSPLHSTPLRPAAIHSTPLHAPFHSTPRHPIPLHSMELMPEFGFPCARLIFAEAKGITPRRLWTTTINHQSQSGTIQIRSHAMKRPPTGIPNGLIAKQPTTELCINATDCPGPFPRPGLGELTIPT